MEGETRNSGSSARNDTQQGNRLGRPLRQTRTLQSIRLSRDACGNVMDPLNAWLLGFFLWGEGLVLSIGDFKEYLLLSVVFSQVFLFPALL